MTHGRLSSLCSSPTTITWSRRPSEARASLSISAKIPGTCTRWRLRGTTRPFRAPRSKVVRPPCHFGRATRCCGCLVPTSSSTEWWRRGPDVHLLPEGVFVRIRSLRSLAMRRRPQLCAPLRRTRGRVLARQKPTLSDAISDQEDSHEGVSQPQDSVSEWSLENRWRSRKNPRNSVAPCRASKLAPCAAVLRIPQVGSPQGGACLLALRWLLPHDTPYSQKGMPSRIRVY